MQVLPNHTSSEKTALNVTAQYSSSEDKSWKMPIPLATSPCGILKSDEKCLDNHFMEIDAQRKAFQSQICGLSYTEEHDSFIFRISFESPSTFR